MRAIRPHAKVTENTSAIMVRLDGGLRLETHQNYSIHRGATAPRCPQRSMADARIHHALQFRQAGAAVAAAAQRGLQGLQTLCCVSRALI